MGEIRTDAARDRARRFRWLDRSVGNSEIEISAADIALADGLSYGGSILPLRTPDAIHIAVARRIGATLVTFDRADGGKRGALWSVRASRDDVVGASDASQLISCRVAVIGRILCRNYWPGRAP